MDLNISRTNFCGKKEILYGLKQASESIHLYSLYQQPRVMRLGENRNVPKLEVSAKAYLDMVTKDESFVEAVKNFSKSELAATKKSLAMIDDGYDKCNPMSYFIDFINEVMSKNKTNSKEGKLALKTLIKKLDA